MVVIVTHTEEGLVTYQGQPHFNLTRALIQIGKLRQGVVKSSTRAMR